MSPRSREIGHTRISVRILCGVLLFTAVLAGNASPAAAHTGFESSEPADGAAVEAGLDRITITFSNEAEEAGEGFVVFDPELGVREPTRTLNPGTGIFVLTFDPAISPGDVGVRWTVKAPDAHPIEGSFQFSISQKTLPPANESTALPETSATTPTPGAADAAETPPDLDAFLTTDGTSATGRVLSDVGRFLSMAGMVVALGFGIFAVTVMRGTRRELSLLLFWIRRAALVTAFATILDACGQVVYETGAGLSALLDPGAYTETLGSSLGFALLLRLASSITVAATARVSMVHAHEARDVVRAMSAAVPIGAGTTRVADHPADYWEDHHVAWDIDRHGMAATAGFVLMLLSHAFDGHTVTEGNRILTGLASATHVLAAALWVGGAGALLLIIHRRATRGEPTHALVMVTRFSVVATLALAAVTGAGLYLAWVILDDPADLWNTAWGRLLMAKTAVVAVAAGLGALNHHVIVPALEGAEENTVAVARLRSTLRNEIIALTLVTGLTALLVRAASSLG